MQFYIIRLIVIYALTSLYLRGKAKTGEIKYIKIKMPTPLWSPLNHPMICALLPRQTTEKTYWSRL